MTSPTILTSLRFKDAPVDKNGVPVHGINLQAQKVDDAFNIVFGRPGISLDVHGIVPEEDLLHWLNFAIEKYNKDNRTGEVLAPGEVERIKKLLV